MERLTRTSDIKNRNPVKMNALRFMRYALSFGGKMNALRFML